MRNAFILLMILFPCLLTACAHTTPLSVELMKPIVAFDEADPEDRLAKDCILILPGDFQDTLPLANEDKTLWRWFFADGFRTIFRNVTVVENIPAPGKLPASTVIVKPELLSWDLGPIPQGPRDQKLWNCNVKFKLQLYTMTGVETVSLVVDKNGWGRDRTEAVSDALKGFMNKSRIKFRNLLM